MSAEAFIYLKGPTNHVAWRLNGRYVSFHPGAKLTDMGSRKIPLPGGSCQVHAWGTDPSYETIEDDEARYGAVQPITLAGLDVLAGEQMVEEFRDEGVPYILWDPSGVGSINCVTLSIVLLNVMVPERVPDVWDAKWGGLFRDLRSKSASGEDWLESAFREPSPNLMHVTQIRDLAAEWVAAHGAHLSALSLGRLQRPTPTKL